MTKTMADMTGKINAKANGRMQILEEEQDAKQSARCEEKKERTGNVLPK